MKISTSYDVSKLFCEVVVTPDIQILLARCSSTAEFARALRGYAFRQIAEAGMPNHYFLLAILDSVDWSDLAYQIMEYNAKSSSKEAIPALRRAVALENY